MKKLILSTLVAVGLIGSACSSAQAAPVALSDYSKEIIGTWGVRTYGYTFKSDGSYSYKPLEGAEGIPAITGTWKIKGKKLTLTQSDQPNPFTIGISFISSDKWEWESRPGRVWDVTRISH
jgi:Domain of unknown function (DUF5004)